MVLEHGLFVKKFPQWRRLWLGQRKFILNYNQSFERCFLGARWGVLWGKAFWKRPKALEKKTQNTKGTHILAWGASEAKAAYAFWRLPQWSKSLSFAKVANK